ncbi:MAG: fluoride efflux transporter CrcB [[Pasteurella] mairii]|uniref:Fluoride-specific ion channel FluC n=1 Tax=[Pasteurella] mairii TaxID=757 RepID=A0A379B2P5_9PAST|nr:fluoride efflux transporter CrcB [[Pasteurella] mairii]SUB32712.1 camphor resistance protein CrcB [[Pasteurella] mairii]
MAIWQSVGLIASGAAMGATLRWGLGLWLNPIFSTLAFGTLIANYLGCLIIGILTALFWQFPAISNEWRLFLVMGFLGSLTTFSSFSAEVVENFLQDKWLLGFGVVALHLLGCLLFTALGIALWRFCSVAWA